MRGNICGLLIVVLLRLTRADNVFARQCQLILLSDGTSTVSSNSYDHNNARNSTNGETRTKTAETREKDLLVAKNRIAAAQLAVQHLAQGDASIVSAVSDMKCNVNFTLSVVLAESHLESVQGFVRQFASLGFRSEDPTAVKEGECIAVVGPFQRRSIVDTRALAQSLFVPQVTVGVANPRIEVYPQTALSRNNYVLSSTSVDIAMQYWTTHRVPRTFITVIYDVVGFDALLSVYGSSLVHENIEVQTFPMPTASVATREDLLAVVTDTLILVRKTGYHTIIAAFEDLEVMLPILGQVANTMDLVGDEYLWTFLTGFDQKAFPRQQQVEASLRSLSPDTNSSLYHLLLGAAVVRPLDKFQWKDPSEDAFVKSWRSQNASQLLGNVSEVEFEDDFFQSPSKGPLVVNSFVFDAVLSLGFHFCLQDNEPIVPPFEGASGFVEYDADSDYSRTPSSVVFGLFNLKAATDNEGLQLALVSIREATRWRDYDENVEFIFHDGTTNPPMPLRDEGDGSYIRRRARIVGLLGMALSLLLSVAAALWVWRHWTQQVVKAGQPEFLLLLCFGSFVTSLSIYPASLDERVGFDAHQLDAACMSVPWLFCLGVIVIDSALFSKLWRINKLFQFKRNSVTVWAVLGPFALFLVSSIFILTMWTISYPLQWTRREVSQVPYVTVGGCDADHTVAFAAPLLTLTMAPTLLTAIMAWRTRDIPGEYSQSQWIFNALLAMSQLWFVGLPIYVILGTQDTDVYFIGFASLVVLFATSAVSLVIGPKVFKVWTESRTGRKSSPRVRTRGYGIGGSGNRGLMGQGEIIVTGLSETSRVENSGDEAQH